MASEKNSEQQTIREKNLQLFHLVEVREKLQGNKIFFALKNLGTSKYAVDKNYKELDKAIAFYEGNLEIWNIKKRHEFNSFIVEFSRLLQNYLSSTFSLIRHNVRICNDLESKVLNKEYNHAVSILNSNDIVVFIKDLRNSVQHVGLPLLSAQLSFVKDESELKHLILLDKEVISRDLANWKSKKYVASIEEINLKDVLKQYQNLINEFYEWFFKRASQIFSKEIKEFVDIDIQIGELNKSLNNG
jgi:hypothetical protein